MNWIKHKNYEMIIIFSKIKIPSLEKTLCKVFAILIWKISFSQKEKGKIMKPFRMFLKVTKSLKISKLSRF